MYTLSHPCVVRMRYRGSRASVPTVMACTLCCAYTTVEGAASFSNFGFLLSSPSRGKKYGKANDRRGVSVTRRDTVLKPIFHGMISLIASLVLFCKPATPNLQSVDLPPRPTPPPPYIFQAGGAAPHFPPRAAVDGAGQVHLTPLKSVATGLGAGFTRAASRTLTFPLDTIKTRSQLSRLGADDRALLPAVGLRVRAAFCLCFS